MTEPFKPSGDSLEQKIASLCRRVETLASGSRTGVCIASRDGSRLERAVFPHLPPSFQAGIRDIPMGPPYFGSCTAAMHGGEIITSHDMTKESRFDERFVAHCLEHSVKSLQSRPVFDADGTPLGTFVMGYTQPTKHADFDEAILVFAADAASAMLKLERGTAPKRGKPGST